MGYQRQSAECAGLATDGRLWFATKLKAYSWVGGDRPADIIDGIKTLREIGFDTFKLNGCEELGLIDNSAVDAAVNTVWRKFVRAFGNQIGVWSGLPWSRQRRWRKC